MEMEQQKLPNATMIIILSILGYLCCCTGILGLIPSAIAFSMARKSEKLYAENPDMYDNISQIKTGKIVALIAIILSVILLLRWIYIFATNDMGEMQEEFMRAYEEALEAQGQ